MARRIIIQHIIEGVVEEEGVFRRRMSSMTTAPIDTILMESRNKTEARSSFEKLQDVLLTNKSTLLNSKSILSTKKSKSTRPPEVSFRLSPIERRFAC